MIQKAKHRKVSRQILNDLVIEMKRDYNLIVDKDKYEVNVLGIMPGSIFIRYYSYGIRRKEKIEYKSKYFKRYEEAYYGFTPGKRTLGEDLGYSYSDNLFIMLSFGLRSYVLNNILYDKSKGNNFEQIEKIFDESGYKIKPNIFNSWICRATDEDRGGEDI